MERQRALVRARPDLAARGAGRRVLEVGPLNREVFGDFFRRRGWEYVGTDKWRGGNPVDPRDVAFADLEVDLADMSVFRDGTFDLVLAQHVVEQVPDYRRGLAEVARVLAVDGEALLEIPYNHRMAVSERVDGAQFGVAWRFGDDIHDALRAEFRTVDEVPLAESAYRGSVFVCTRAAREAAAAPSGAAAS
jgi:SAM-dependent methyltransferase